MIKAATTVIELTPPLTRILGPSIVKATLFIVAVLCYKHICSEMSTFIVSVLP